MSMKLICSHKNECTDESCPHRQPHEDCGHECQRVAGARCVMDVASLPVIGDQSTMAIFISRREEEAA